MTKPSALDRLRARHGLPPTPLPPLPSVLSVPCSRDEPKFGAKNGPKDGAPRTDRTDRSPSDILLGSKEAILWRDKCLPGAARVPTSPEATGSGSAAPRLRNFRELLEQDTDRTDGRPPPELADILAALPGATFTTRPATPAPA